MGCPRCQNAKYPAEFDSGESPSDTTKYCKDCKYPTLSQEQRARIGRKLLAIKPALVLSGTPLKGIQPKYFGEILDKHRRPEAELKDLYSEWEKERFKTENFYDWIADIEPKASVLQLGDGERAEYEVTVKDGKLVGKHVSIKHSEHAFVLSDEGTFYASPKDTQSDTRIHHSSFLSGRPVRSAGVFFCNGGMQGYERSIFYVKDYSGHYTPGIDEIVRLRDRLIELGEGQLQFWYVCGGSTPHWKGPIIDFDIGKPDIRQLVETKSKKAVPDLIALSSDRLVKTSTGKTLTRPVTDL